MSRAVTAIALVLAFWAPSSLAGAGVYTDDLSRCLVKSATPTDRMNFLVWMFAAMGRHPAVEAYSNFSEAHRVASTKEAAGLMQRLMTVDCRSETVTAIKYEGGSAVEAAFGTLGEAATRELMSDPAVAKGMASLADYLDTAAFEKLSVEAGTSVGASATK